MKDCWLASQNARTMKIILYFHFRSGSRCSHRTRGGAKIDPVQVDPLSIPEHNRRDFRSGASVPSVNRRPIRYGFRAVTVAIRYGVNMAWYTVWWRHWVTSYGNDTDKQWRYSVSVRAGCQISSLNEVMTSLIRTSAITLTSVDPN